MKLRDLNNLLVRGRARIWTWICLTPNPVCFTPQCATNLGGARHGTWSETERDELLEAMFRGSHALRTGWHQAGRPPLPWQPESCTATSWAVEKFFTWVKDSFLSQWEEKATRELLPQPHHERELPGAVSQETQEKVKSRRKGVWSVELMDEWITSPRKQLEKIREKLRSQV